MIDVSSYTRSYGYKGSYPLGCTRLPGEIHRGLKKDVCVLERGIQPAFSHKVCEVTMQIVVKTLTRQEKYV